MIKITTENELFPNELDALGLFFAHCYQNVVPTDIYRFHGYIGHTEVAYIRFETNGTPKTFVLQETSYGDLAKVRDDETAQQFLEWAENPNHNADMATVGYKRNITKLPIEFHLSTFESALTDNPDPMEGMHNGDFITLDLCIDRFRKRFHEQLGNLTKVGMILAKKMKEKERVDHDLYISFKGVDSFTKINVGLDRVYPRLPEDGEYALGDKPINQADWADVAMDIQMLVKRISHGSNQINRMIERFKGLLSPNPIIQTVFSAELKTQLMASSHFMKQYYTFNHEDGRAVIEQEANYIIRLLSERGGNIGLDLNSWIVWNYDVEGRPEEIKDEKLNIRDYLYKHFTTSFVDALYAYLLKISNPYIKPYRFREVITEDDGVAIGSIRQA